MKRAAYSGGKGKESGMLANNNLKICRKLVRRDFFFHKAGSLLLILAAALVTGLYSFIFLLGSAVEGAFLLSYQYAYGSSSHILYTGMTERQAEAVSGHPDVRSAVRSGSPGQISSPLIGQRSVTLAVADWDYAETVFSLPSTGRLPQEADEIALDIYTMDSLGIPHSLGASVSIPWIDSGAKEHTDTFTLCGWWEGPANFTEACAWITQETADGLLPGWDDKDAPCVTLGVTLWQPKDLEKQAALLLEDQGISGAAFTTSLAYDQPRREQAAGQSMPYYAPAALVLVCGFLMIYGIAHVDRERDVLFFAGLKAQGMTPRQLRYFLLAKSFFVTLAGLLPGWLIGFFLEYLTAERLISGMSAHPALYFLDWPPFLAAALCTLGTVLLSLLLPMLRLSDSLPARTLRKRNGSSRREKGFPDGRITLPRLAFRTLKRSRGRIFLSACALSASTLLLSALWLLFIGLKEDVYLSALSPWDYSITDGSAALSLQIYNQDSRALTQDALRQLADRPETVSVSALKTREISLTASAALRKRLTDFYNQPYDETRTLRDTQKAFPEWCQGLSRLEQTGEYTALVIGMEGAYLDYLLEYSPFTSGSFDEDAFLSGRYVITGGAWHEGVSAPMAGETVTLAGQTFSVLGSVMHDDAYLSGSDSPEAAFSIAFILPLPAFDALFPGQGIRQIAVNIDHSAQASFEAWLDGWTQSLARGVGLNRRSEYQANFANARLNMVLPQLIVSAVLMGIAPLNFCDLLIAKAVSRRREFAVYESLGMTGGQLASLLLLEGLLYGGLYALFIGPPAVLFTRFVMPGVVSGYSWASVYTFSLAPLWIILPVILLLCLLVPLSCLSFLRRGSIRQRMGTGSRS